MERNSDYGPTKEVFFEAMAAGWAQNAQKGTIAELPGLKVITFSTEDGFRVVDSYYAS